LLSSHNDKYIEWLVRGVGRTHTVMHFHKMSVESWKIIRSAVWWHTVHYWLLHDTMCCKFLVCVVSEKSLIIDAMISVLLKDTE